jgi:hypothetical protein
MEKRLNENSEEEPQVPQRSRLDTKVTIFRRRSLFRKSHAPSDPAGRIYKLVLSTNRVNRYSGRMSSSRTRLNV